MMRLRLAILPLFFLLTFAVWADLSRRKGLRIRQNHGNRVSPTHQLPQGNAAYARIARWNRILSNTRHRRHGSNPQKDEVDSIVPLATADEGLSTEEEVQEVQQEEEIRIADQELSFQDEVLLATNSQSAGKKSKGGSYRDGEDSVGDDDVYDNNRDKGKKGAKKGSRGDDDDSEGGVVEKKTQKKQFKGGKKMKKKKPKSDYANGGKKSKLSAPTMAPTMERYSSYGPTEIQRPETKPACPVDEPECNRTQRPI
jgi:hypothetical protein